MAATVGVDMPGLPRSDRPMLGLLARVVEAMDEAALVVDRRGMVVVANRSAAELFEVPEAGAAVRPLHEFVGVDEPVISNELVSAFAGRGVPRQRIAITTAAGVQRVVRFTATPIRGAKGRASLAMLLVNDVTREERTNAYWQAVGSGAEGLTGDLDIDHVLRSAAEQLSRALPGDVVLGIWLLAVDEQQLELRLCRGVTDATAARLASIPLDCVSVLCEAARMRRPRYVEDGSPRPPEYDMDHRLIDDERLASWVGAPLAVHGTVMGVMGFGLRGPRRFEPQDLEAVETLSRLFAVALQHAELYETSQRQASLLQREQQLQSELSQAITHDLRTPLMAIRGRAEVLEDGLLSPEGLSLAELTTGLAKIRGTADRMAGRLSELTDALRLQSGQAVQLRKQATDLVALTRTAADEHQQTTQQHRIHVHTDTPTLVGQWDAARLGRVLDNLLANAIKYSPQGGEVSLRLEREDTAEESWAVLRVRDRGLGIGPADLPHIFERFYRGENAVDVRGFGLGLPASLGDCATARRHARRRADCTDRHHVRVAPAAAQGVVLWAATRPSGAEDTPATQAAGGVCSSDRPPD